MSDSPSETQHQADSRRDFIRGSSLLLAGAVPAALATAANTVPALTRTKRSYRLGLIGCGYRGITAATQAMKTTSANVTLVAVADLFQDRIQQSCRSLKGKCAEHFDVTENRRYAGFDAYQRLLQSDLDAVILATAPGFRPVHFQAAVEAGKHVFAEKPVAVDPLGVRDFSQSCQLASSSGVSVAVGLQRRHAENCRDTIEQLQAGAIGDLQYARAYCVRPVPRMHPRRRGQSELEHQLRNWQHFGWVGGDNIVEQHVQSLDLMNWLAGDHPIEALGVGGWKDFKLGPAVGAALATDQTAFERGVFDHHAVEFVYRSGFRLLSINHWTEGSRTELSEWVFGTKGSCDLTNGAIYDQDRQLLWKSDGARDGLKLAFEAFFGNLSRGELSAEGLSAAQSTMTAIMGRMATYQGTRVRWADCAASRLKLADFQAFRSLQDASPPIARASTA
jgi:myo-inositol 2-dehydrogenase / D-chiro-inositol 1-dehydrogenase